MTLKPTQQAKKRENVSGTCGVFHHQMAASPGAVQSRFVNMTECAPQNDCKQRVFCDFQGTEVYRGGKCIDKFSNSIVQAVSDNICEMGVEKLV